MKNTSISRFLIARSAACSAHAPYAVKADHEGEIEPMMLCCFKQAREAILMSSRPVCGELLLLWFIVIVVSIWLPGVFITLQEVALEPQ
jgi:hypothetical protein